MIPLDYYLQGHMKSLVYERKSQTVAELTGCFFSATAQIGNDGTMLCRVTTSLLRRARTCLREGGDHFEQLIVISYCMNKNCKALHSILLFFIYFCQKLQLYMFI
jgi:hypothetical protein